MQVACRGADVAMAQQLLDGEEVHAALQQVGGETVAQGLACMPAFATGHTDAHLGARAKAAQHHGVDHALT